MKFSIRETSLTSCDVTAFDPLSNNRTALPLPISAETVRGSLESLLMDPDQVGLTSNGVEFVRHETGLAISTQAGSIMINWRFLFWLVQRPFG